FTVDRASFTVAPGGVQEMTITFRPTEGGAVSGKLTLTSNDPDEGELDILLSGVGKTTFVDVAGEAGVGNTVTKGGIAWGDYDGDGDPDLFAVDSNPLKGNVLYRNEGGGRFSDVTSSAGVGAMGNSKGGVWGDFDNDGDPDLYVTRSGAQNILYRNEGDGVFSDISEKAGVDVDNEGIGAVWVDYDNDGWLDLYTVREPVKLYRNGGDGAFADVTDAAGVGDLGGKVENGAWGDYDNDGDADLYVSNREQANVLFRNEGDGTFVDGTLDAGVPGHSSGTTLSAVWGDYDNDGDLDLYVLESNGFRTNLLYRNNGSGTFTDVTETAGVGDNGAGTGAVWGDFDNDGDLDLYVSNGGPLRLGTSFPNVLYR
ncbi:MAG: VCBS repeat-containing protein, partial [Candidatus Latescibacteria bacterium]|nr:VCBS repeat-containing protein [Candidatus Latescibacterota bacterium]